MQRPLVMDWRTDERVRDIDDEFMFGPSLLVNPVTVAGATERLVFLPPAAAWYDFWTGEKLEGGQQIAAKAPLDRIPLYVRGGAIVPLGPESEYADQHPEGPIEVRVYPGANGSFTFYQDEGDSYRYEKGDYATIPLEWNDAAGTLRIGGREGHYNGMPQKMVFNVTLVSRSVGTGLAASESAKDVVYSGAPVEIRLR